MPFSRFRFSLLHLLILVALVAIVLGVIAYVQSHPEWRDPFTLLSTLAFFGLVCCFCFWLGWLIPSGPWPARLFAAGFLIGVGVEFLAFAFFTKHNVVVSIPAGRTYDGWYPLSVPMARILLGVGWASNHEIIGALAGMALSGVLLGSGLSAFWLLGGRVMAPGERYRRKHL